MADKVKVKVVFDSIGVATGETVGTPPVALSEEVFRGDEVELEKHDADRHLATGAVVLANDPRAKHIKANPLHQSGVIRNIEPVQLEQTEAGAPGDTVSRETGIDANTDLGSLGVRELKQLAKDWNVEVGARDNKPTLVAALKAVQAEKTAPEAPAGPTPDVGGDPVTDDGSSGDATPASSE